MGLHLRVVGLPDGAAGLAREGLNALELAHIPGRLLERMRRRRAGALVLVAREAPMNRRAFLAAIAGVLAWRPKGDTVTLRIPVRFTPRPSVEWEWPELVRHYGYNVGPTITVESVGR